MKQARRTSAPELGAELPNIDTVRAKVIVTTALSLLGKLGMNIAALKLGRWATTCDNPEGCQKIEASDETDAQNQPSKEEEKIKQAGSANTALIKLNRSMTNTEGMAMCGSGKTPCEANRTWAGVSCENGRVSVLPLEDIGLSGTIDVDALLQLQALRVISFQNNSFSGPIPDFNRLGALKAIFLSRNQFSGENSFGLLCKNGVIEEDNQFSGIIPLLAQPTSAFLDLSNNLLQGGNSGKSPEIQHELTRAGKGWGRTGGGPRRAAGPGADERERGAFGLTDLMKAGAEVLGNGALGSSYKAMMTNGMTVGGEEDKGHE
ncbi:leucine-rich repeat protein kinase family protein [Actinidia rufa]|uniref:Leucine-rich repeat protein kinase family protein n=1 Tax=Actinidia rufa TaxID=165716 RepID=A0A7J0FEU5_9ERIC|nr:leucine-rich repeat protein kinase family protein [Actinidia rufa]